MWIFVCLLILLYSLYDVRKPYGYPPGPPWMPVIGNLFQFLKLLNVFNYTHLVWDHWAAKYGSLLGLRLGSDRIVIVSEYKLAREVLTRDEFEGRPDGFLFRMRSFGKRLGVVFTDGLFGHEQRMFCLKNLKELGFGRKSMEHKITEEISEFIQLLRIKSQHGPVELHSIINVYVMNTVWSMIAGKRFSQNSSEVLSLLDCIHASFRMQDMSGGLLNQLPFIRFIGPGWKIYKRNVDITAKLISFIQVTVEEHKVSIKPEKTRDLIDAFLHKIQQKESSDTNFTEEQLLIVLMDLFMAGADTTTNTITFVMMLLMKYPKVQKKAQQELDRVFQTNLEPALQDRSRLNYFEAMIMEVQRFCNIAPTTIPHRAKECVQLNGFIIPKDTTVLISLYNIHMDKKYWIDPDVFRPERFLDEHGKLVHDERLIPFGLGRRRCLGETLARASVFKYVSTILLNYSISSPNGTDINLKPIDGAILSPVPFSAVLTPRIKKHF